jgi:preprotein translocase subunit SecA
MIQSILKTVFGTRNDRLLKSVQGTIYKINDLERRFQAMTDTALAAMTAEFRQRIANGEHLDSVAPEAFATVREAGKRVLNMRHFDVQLVGGLMLHNGRIAEMKTGEGKTLVATLPAYLNALSGKGVHVVTVNDYLARRDAEWMGRIHRFLGLSVGCIFSGMKEQVKREAYAADITYGQNNEFGFDYLRDNMRFSADELLQRGHNFAIVDEVDSILIDEARTPLIISGPAEESTDKYLAINRVIPQLKKEGNFTIDNRSKQPMLTEQGTKLAEELLQIENLYDPKNIEILHHVNQALRAHTTLERDSDYIVENGEVVIIDEFTGRKMAGRRWSNGLHQAVEAKEGLKVARENQTLASITFQNYFRMYSKLSGMTGTADTEAMEFKQIYNLEVVSIPANRKMVRINHSDVVYRTREEKYDAVLEKIKEVNGKGQPCLVGTISIEQSEVLSSLLTKLEIPHNVLNAKFHEREAEIVAQAGRLGAVTISTNMAGRGTDILLGGNPEFLASSDTKTKDPTDPAFIAALEKYRVQCQEEHDRVVAAGGLFIMGTERHESRRIDNQLRGRAGRQGDPGEAQFFISLQDDLMRRFGGEWMESMMARVGWEKGVALDGRMISRSIENAQKRVEAFHFDSRKHVTDYDDVMNKQRQVIYNLRTRLVNGEEVREEVLGMIHDLIEDSVVSVCQENIKPINWDINSLIERFTFLTNSQIQKPDSLALDQQAVFDWLKGAAEERYARHVEAMNEKLKHIEALGKREESPLMVQISRARNKPFEFTTIEQDTLLEALDHFWNIHLQEMDHLREGIGLRGYGQKNPLHEYQKEGFLLFQGMLSELRESSVRRLFFYDVPDAKELFEQFQEEMRRRAELEKQMSMVHENPEPVGGSGAPQPQAGIVQQPQVSAEEQRAKLEAQRKARRKM